MHIFCILSEFNESFSLLWRNFTHVECIYDFKPKVNKTAFIVHCTLEKGERSSEVLKATTNTGGFFLFPILLKFGRHKFEPDSAHHTKFQLNRSCFF